MKKALEVEYGNGILYGKPGCGKTTAFCQLEEHAKMRGAKLLYVDLEGGLKRRLEVAHPMMSVMRPEKFIEFNDIYNRLGSHLKDIDAMSRALAAKDVTKIEMLNKKLLGHEAWFTGKPNAEKWYHYLHVTIDSFSETQTSAMDHIVPNTGFLEIKNPQIQDWGKNINMIMFMTKAFRDLPINAWFTAHELNRTDEENNVISIVPKFSGKTAPETVCGMLDIVGYYTSVNAGPTQVKRVMYFQPLGKASKTIVKDRFDSLGTSVENPNFGELFQKLGLDCVQPVITHEQVMEFLSSVKK